MIDQNELPEGWEIVPLSQIAIKISDGSHNPPKEKSFGIPMISAKDVQNNLIKFDNPRYISESEFEIENKRTQIKEGDILLTIVATIGRTAVVPKNIKPFTLQRSVAVIKTNTNSNFLCYYFQSSFFQKQLNEYAKGTAQKGVYLKTLSTLKIILPPISHQEPIVTKIEELFSQLDNGIAQLKTAQAQLKVYRQAVLKWAFEGRLTNADVKEEELPEGWKWVKLNEICKIIGGVTKGRDFKGQETIQLPYLRVANVQDGYLNLKEIKTIEVLPSDKEKYRLLYGDILYTEGGDKDKLGRGTIWKNEIENCIHQNHIFRARPISNEIDSKYIGYFSQTRLAKNYFFKHGKQTTNLASINLKILSNLPLPLCSFSEQQHIVQEIESRLSVCDNLEETIKQGLQQAEALRQSILKRAFEGKLVPQDTNNNHK